MRAASLCRSLPALFLALTAPLACTPTRNHRGPASRLGPEGPAPEPTGGDAAVITPPTADASADPTPPPAGTDSAPPATDSSAPPTPTTCTPPLVTCKGSKLACEPPLWDFETDAQGWRSDNFQVNVTFDHPAPSTQRPHGGAKSLAAPFEVAHLKGTLRIFRELCGYSRLQGSSAFLDLKGRTLSAWVYFATVSGQGLAGTCRLEGHGNTSQKIGANKPVTPILPDRWIRVATPIDEPGSDQMASIELYCALSLPNTNTFTGTLFLDDVGY